MDLLTIKNIIDQAFSKTGYAMSKFVILVPNSVSISITKKDDIINVSFLDNLPVVKTKKFFLPIKTEVEGLNLGKEFGFIKLKNFPDIKFSYSEEEEEEEQRFGSQAFSFDNEKIMSEISKKYSDSKRKKVAELALEYAIEWASLASNGGVDFKQCSEHNKKKLYKDCQRFVYENLLNSKKIETKSSSIGLMLLYFFLPAIINWVVKKFMDQLVKKPSLYFTA